MDPTHNTVEHQIRINEIEGGRRIQLSWLTSEFRLSGGRFYGRKRIWAVRSERVGSKGIRLNLGLRGAKGSRGWRAAPIRPRCEIMCVYVSHRDLHYSLFRLCCCPTEKWNIGWFTKTGLWKKKKDFELSRDIWRGMEIIRNFLFSFRNKRSLSLFLFLLLREKPKIRFTPIILETSLYTRFPIRYSIQYSFHSVSKPFHCDSFRYASISLPFV